MVAPIWIAVGSGPSVDMLNPVRCEIGPACTITTNGGILYCPDPDIYLTADMKAGWIYAEHAAKARESGTLLVTLKRELSALIARNVSDYDEFLAVSSGAMSRKSYGRFLLSGVTVLEYACHNGAAEVHLVGFDGHASGHASYAHCSSEVHDKSIRMTETVFVPAAHELATVWPDVQFVHHGRPVFQVDCANWRQPGEK